MLNLLFGLVILLALGFVVWAGWTYHKSGRLKNASGIVTLVAMIASLPLGTRLVMERSSFLSRASSEPQVVAVQYQPSGQGGTIYVTLTEAGFVYMEFETNSGKQIVLGQGKVEPRIAHSFVISDAQEFTSEGKIFVNGREDLQRVSLK